MIGYLRIAVLVATFSVECEFALAEDTLLLGKRGKSLFSETFEGTEVPSAWKVNTGVAQLKEGTLRLSEKASDNHVGAFRYALPMQNMVIQLDFQMDGAKTFHLGFDPAPGVLDKKGHLYTLAVSRDRWSIIENNDKAKPESKPTVHAKGNLALEDNKRYTLRLENKGEEVVATIVGHGSLKAKSHDFQVKKPGLVFRAGGPDAAGVMIDNLQVHELQ